MTYHAPVGVPSAGMPTEHPVIMVDGNYEDNRSDQPNSGLSGGPAVHHGAPGAPDDKQMSANNYQALKNTK